MNKTVKYILIAVVIIAALALIIWGIKSYLESRSTQPGPGPTPNPNPADITNIFSNLFSGDFWSNLFGGKKCDPNKNCYQKNGDYNLQCCQTADGGQGTFKCDCNNPGYTTMGEYKESCKEGRVNFIIDCG